MLEFTEPAWRLRCDPATRADEDWVTELRVAQRVVRQLRSVGDALAWRVFRYDRRAIVALSSNDSPGPFVGKKGLDYELGSVIDHWRDRGSFTLLHDLTSVLRIMDSTEVQPDGSLMLREVKSSPRACASKQIGRAEAALAAINGRSALPTDDPQVQTCLWRSSAQLKTHARRLRPMIDRTGTSGYWIGRVGGRVAGIVNLLVLAQNGEDPATQWEEYAASRSATLGRHLPGALHHLKAVSADSAARDPGIAPYGIYPLPAWHRAQISGECCALAVECQGLAIL